MKRLQAGFFDRGTHSLAFLHHENLGRPRILFLHGLGASAKQFERELLIFGKEYDVAALSLRGQGESTRPSGDRGEDMALAALAGDVLAWMEAHQWDQPHVVACSMGGVVAMDALRQKSDAFQSLVTFGTTPELNFGGRAMKAAFWFTDILLPSLFPRWFAATMAKATTDIPEAQERFKEDLRTACTQKRTVYQLRCHLIQYDYLRVLKETQIPVLFLQGEKDKAINKKLDELWPQLESNTHLRRQSLSNAGHIANYDQPKAFGQAVETFLREQDRHGR